MAPRGFQPGTKCGVCGAATRRLHATGTGNKARGQRPKWFVCSRGHKLVRKAGQ